MGLGFFLVNFTKKEMLFFHEISGDKAREVAGTASSASIVSWYMIKNMSDYISFVPEQDDEWFFSISLKEILDSFSDVTEYVIKDLVKNEVLKDNGYIYLDDDKSIRIRVLKNI